MGSIFFFGLVILFIIESITLLFLLFASRERLNAPIFNKIKIFYILFPIISMLAGVSIANWTKYGSQTLLLWAIPISALIIIGIIVKNITNSNKAEKIEGDLKIEDGYNTTESPIQKIFFILYFIIFLFGDFTAYASLMGSHPVLFFLPIVTLLVEMVLFIFIMFLPRIGFGVLKFFYLALPIFSFYVGSTIRYYNDTETMLIINSFLILVFVIIYLFLLRKK